MNDRRVFARSPYQITETGQIGPNAAKPEGL